MSNVLFENIGGAEAADEAVEIFFARVLTDKTIGHFFNDMDLEGQKEKQKEFFIMVFGGPTKFTHSEMRKVHAHLVRRGLSERHFLAVIQHLQRTLEELKIPPDLIREVRKIAENMHDEVLNL